MLPFMSRDAPRPRVVLITDPGPDPDDVKALLVAALLHKERKIDLAAVIANGGGQPAARARLARCVLDHVGEKAVPVGVGTRGRNYVECDHEYALEGYNNVDENSLGDGRGLLRAVVAESPPRGLSVVCISSLRDFADLIREQPAEVITKVAVAAIMGGLERDDKSPGGWRPDSSVNNGFDLDAAADVYAFCFTQGVRMAVVSRHAVPLLPMQLARSFAERAECPIMRYLADAQFLGLECLWHKLCNGKLPPRCNRRWFFETFCGVASTDFDKHGYESLGEDAAIVSHLNGYVKPYDVVALMTILPNTRSLFEMKRFADAVYDLNGVRHLLLLDAAHAVPLEPLLRLLRNVYHATVLACKEQKDARRPSEEQAKRAAGERFTGLRSAGSLPASPLLGDMGKRIRRSSSSIADPADAGEAADIDCWAVYSSPVLEVSSGIDTPPPLSLLHGPHSPTASTPNATCNRGELGNALPLPEQRTSRIIDEGATTRSLPREVVSGASMNSLSTNTKEDDKHLSAPPSPQRNRSAMPCAPPAEDVPLPMMPAPVARRHSFHGTGTAGKHHTPALVCGVRDAAAAGDGEGANELQDTMRFTPARTATMHSLSDKVQDASALRTLLHIGAHHFVQSTKQRLPLGPLPVPALQLPGGCQHQAPSDTIPSPTASPLWSIASSGSASPKLLPLCPTFTSPSNRRRGLSFSWTASTTGSAQLVSPLSSGAEPWPRAWSVPSTSPIIMCQASKSPGPVVHQRALLSSPSPSTSWPIGSQLLSARMHFSASSKSAAREHDPGRAVSRSSGASFFSAAAAADLGVLILLAAKAAQEGRRSSLPSPHSVTENDNVMNNDVEPYAESRAGAAAPTGPSVTGVDVAHADPGADTKVICALGKPVESGNRHRSSVSWPSPLSMIKVGSLAEVSATASLDAQSRSEVIPAVMKSAFPAALPATAKLSPRHQREHQVAGFLHSALEQAHREKTWVAACTTFTMVCAIGVGMAGQALLALHSAESSPAACELPTDAQVAATHPRLVMVHVGLYCVWQSAALVVLLLVRPVESQSSRLRAVAGVAVASGCVAAATSTPVVVGAVQDLLQATAAAAHPPAGHCTLLTCVATGGRSGIAYSLWLVAEAVTALAVSLFATEPPVRAFLHNSLPFTGYDASREARIRRRRLLRSLWLSLWRFSGAHSAAEMAKIVLWLGFGCAVTCNDGMAVACITIAGACYSAVIAAAALWPPVRLYAQAVLARASARPGLRPALAALVGFGSAAESDPDELAMEATRSFHPVTLDESAVKRLKLRRSAATPMAGAPEEEQRQADTSTADRANVVGLDAPTSNASAAFIDRYVCHSWEDNVDAKARALDEWATTYSASHGGRAPVVWMDSLCCGPSSAPTEQLAHMPFRMARCHRLLLLVGPTLAEQLSCAGELFTWRVLGGRLDMVDVVPVAEDTDELEAIVASLDAFHVMWARGSPQMQGATRALVRLVELAGVARFNEVLRAYMPYVRDTVLARSMP